MFNPDNCPDHVTVSNTEQETYLLKCQRCGETYEPALPCPVDMFLAQMEAFGKRHKSCQATSEEAIANV